jgi:CRISPR/Cas system-associated exonuclease Cas4 (RecB family)
MTLPVTKDSDEHGKKPLYISWSRLKEWETCQHHTWQKMQGTPRAKMDGRIFLHGTLADRAMRRWLELPDGTQQKGQMAQFVDELWDEHTGPEAEYEIKWRGNKKDDQAKVRELAKRVVNKVEQFLIERVLPHEYQPEMRFSVPLRIPDLNGEKRTIFLRGGIDIAVRHADAAAMQLEPRMRQVWLYDLKATESDDYINTLLPQLIFYQLMWAAMQGTPFDRIGMAYLVPAAKRQYRELHVTEDDRRYLMTRVIKCAHGMWRGDKDPVKENGPCWNCDVKHACPKWNRPVHQASGKLWVPF